MEQKTKKTKVIHMKDLVQSIKDQINNKNNIVIERLEDNTLDNISKNNLTTINKLKYVNSANEYKQLLLSGYHWYLNVEVRSMNDDIVGNELGSKAKETARSSAINVSLQIFKLCVEYPKLRYWVPPDKKTVTHICTHKKLFLSYVKDDPWWLTPDDPVKKVIVEGKYIIDAYWLVKKQ